MPQTAGPAQRAQLLHHRPAVQRVGPRDPAPQGEESQGSGAGHGEIGVPPAEVLAQEGGQRRPDDRRDREAGHDQREGLSAMAGADDVGGHHGAGTEIGTLRHSADEARQREHPEARGGGRQDVTQDEQAHQAEEQRPPVEPAPPPASPAARRSPRRRHRR